MTDAPLRNLHSQDHWDEGVHWKKHKLHCLKCGNNVGTIAKVFASDKILFSAKHVAIQMPANQSPLISVSGYPSSQLGFSYWTELILMLETQPSLKDTLAIRRVRASLSVAWTHNGERLTARLLVCGACVSTDRPDPRREWRAQDAEPEAAARKGPPRAPSRRG